MSKFSHIDSKGKPNMVDVSDKKVTSRTAVARTVISVSQEIATALVDNDFQTPKGPVFDTAIIAGTMGVKKTSDLIPLCHPLPISKCHIDIDLNDDHEIIIECLVKVSGQTGVEMEALTGCSIAALTIYDMCKAYSHDIVIKDTRLIKKTGGKSDWDHE